MISGKPSRLDSHEIVRQIRRFCNSAREVSSLHLSVVPIMEIESVLVDKGASIADCSSAEAMVSLDGSIFTQHFLEETRNWSLVVPRSIQNQELKKLKTVLDEQQLQQGVQRMAEAITRSYGTNPLTIIAIMTGSLVLLADLIRRLEMPLRIGLIQASSYRGGMTSGELTVNDQMMLDIRGRDVLLIDDIFDTGKTLSQIVERMRQLAPTSVRTAVLLRKQGTQTVPFEPDFVAFSIPDEFVVGYGLDYEDQYRNLPFLAAMEPEDLRAHRSI